MDERRKRFSFSARYKGNWRKANNNNTPDDRFLMYLVSQSDIFQIEQNFYFCLS
jgi:hypothetical protein